MLEMTHQTKDKLIRDIKAAGYKVRGDVLRHGLTEKGALEIESAVIDQIGIDNLRPIG